MRRPLCLLGLSFVMVLLLGLHLIPHSTSVCGGPNGETVTVAGRVEWKEYKISGLEKVLVVTLEQAVVLKPDQISVLKQIIIDSDTDFFNHFDIDSVKKTEKLIKENRDRFVREDAEEITGILCYLGGGENPAVGSFVLVEGKFRSFSHATNPGEFDAADYYHVMGQQGRLMKASCMAQSGNFSVVREGLYRFREYLSLLLGACYPEREASVMRAVLLGEKSMLDEEVKSLYQQNGIIHILAISGLHLSILGMGFHKLLHRLHVPKIVNIILSVTLMYSYGMMAGMGISVVRALVMFALKLGAGLFGRTYDLLTAMMTAALLILVRQPLYLTNSGFLFSFGAVCGIGLLPAVSGQFPSESRLLKAVFTGGWISLCTLPVYLCFYYEFPTYSVVLNLIVLPCMGVLLLSGAAAAGAAACFLPLGRLAAFPGIWILTFYEKCASFCLRLPGQRWVTGRPKDWQVMAFLVFLAAAVFLAGKGKKAYFSCAVFGAVILLGFQTPKGFEITMLDIGQGDCIYLADGRGGCYLIDGGSSDKKEVETYQITPFLKYRGVKRLDAVFITHSDADHINGIRGLLENYREAGIEIGCLFLPDLAEESRDENYLYLASLAQRCDVSVRRLHEGECLENGKLGLVCLHPKRSYVNQNANAGSTVLYLTYENFSALFTGDLEGEGENLVTQRLAQMRAADILPERVTMLKTAHHGSKNSTKEAFLELLNPRIALISAGRDNSYGHPHRETLERLENCGCQIYQTSGSGAVTVRVESRGVRVEEYLSR